MVAWFAGKSRYSRIAWNPRVTDSGFAPNPGTGDTAEPAISIGAHQWEMASGNFDPGPANGTGSEVLGAIPQENQFVLSS